ncbi:hypothetical protein [Hymenobacter sp. DG25A]|jgi:hypothetical protein|uniref:hypothetical protein n=1 Tax=Hymenobacter sp. DG25A TaxID=1385663 RepID=UPI000A892F71|nr:hypothetical protein [Hymenobacter sp. DG25A]
MKSAFYSLLGGALIVLLSAGDTHAATVSVASLSTTSVAAGNSSWVSKSEKKKRLRSNAKRLRKMRRQRY